MRTAVAQCTICSIGLDREQAEAAWCAACGSYVCDRHEGTAPVDHTRAQAHVTEEEDENASE